MGLIRRHPIVLALAVAAVLSIQLVPQSTFFGDDYIRLGILEGTTEGIHATPLDLYCFMDGSTESVRNSMETGPIPWFVHPQFKVNFFRPVSSASLALFIFAVSDPHWVNVAWTAGRWVLMTTRPARTWVTFSISLRHFGQFTSPPMPGPCGKAAIENA